jgi:hypothetical protein
LAEELARLAGALEQLPNTFLLSSCIALNDSSSSPALPYLTLLACANLAAQSIERVLTIA